MSINPESEEAIPYTLPLPEHGEGHPFQCPAATVPDIPALRIKAVSLKRISLRRIP
jgi:hypothetical protein